MDETWKLKCPSCGELMGDGAPYKTFMPLTQPSGEFSSGDPEPDWLRDAPIAGYQFRCDCGCEVDVPVSAGKGVTA